MDPDHGARWVLGLDEAGRGSVVGPLVVGGFLVREDRLEELPAAGACDSKQISPSRREVVYGNLAALGDRTVVVLPPTRVDAAVRHHGLNLLEARAFAQIIRRARPALTYVDACDPVAARFGRLVRALSGWNAPVVAEHRADRDRPIVGAASIVAKVRRDRAVASLARRLGLEVGSGYPSDPRTVACLRDELATASAEATWIRHSWSTATRLKPPPRLVPLDEFAR